MHDSLSYDVVIVGGGPAGLSAALTLGRARKRVLLCDSGPRRNAAASRIHNFVTRDGTPPDEFRRIGGQQLSTYPNVQVRETRVSGITGSKGAFQVELDADVAAARRILLCTGMVDEMLPIEGFVELWGWSIFQCPYCHGWEVRDRSWGCLASATNAAHLLPFASMLRGWSSDVAVFVDGTFELPEETSARLRAAGVRVETSPVVRLVARERRLDVIELSNGSRVECEVLFAQPPQRQVDLVLELEVALGDDGFVRIDPMSRETSIPGIYAAGDLTTRMQGAIHAAAAGSHGAGAVNVELTMELAAVGAL